MADSERLTFKPRQTTIISSMSQTDCMAAAEKLAAASLCEGPGKRPCGACRNCRKIAQRIHPDVIYVRRETDAKGKTKKEISVEQIRALSEEAVIAPNEAERKAFIIEDADHMNISAQNAALKLFEEPPNDSVFILCVSSVLRLLETVRSRCAVINLNAADEPDRAEAAKLSAEYLTLVSSGRELELVGWCYANEDMEGVDADALFAQIASDITDMLCLRKSSGGLETPELVRLKGVIDKCIEMRKLNAGVKLLFGLLLTQSLRRE